MTEGKLFEDYEEGEVYHSRGRTVTNSDIRMWIGATDATHPNHVNEEYAKDHPLFDGMVAPGVLTLSIADGFCAEHIAEPAAYGMNYGHDNVRYLAPVYVGDTISGDVEITGTSDHSDEWGLVELDVELTNQDGETVMVEDHSILVAKSASAVEQ